MKSSKLREACRQEKLKVQVLDVLEASKLVGRVQLLFNRRRQEVKLKADET